MEKENNSDINEDTLNEFKNLWSLGLGHSGRRFDGKNPLSEKNKIATKDSWKTLEMPKENIVTKLNLKISSESMDILKFGHIPEAMEDHWFMYCDDDTIRYYRSWTGILIYECNFIPVEDGYELTLLTINRDKKQYGETDTEADVWLFLYLITAEVGGDSYAIWDKYREVKRRGG